MATKARKPDGYCPFFLDEIDGVHYITIQLEGDTVKVLRAKAPKRSRSNTLGLDKDSGVPIENRQSKPRRKKDEL